MNSKKKIKQNIMKMVPSAKMVQKWAAYSKIAFMVNEEKTCLCITGNIYYIYSNENE